MAMITTDSTHYQNIAKAIRHQARTTKAYKPDDMPKGIEAVYYAGEEAGIGRGYAVGYEAGVAAAGNTIAKIENDILYITKT